MGLYGHRFYFKDGYPTVRETKEKFHEITGLSLGFTADVYLQQFMTEREDIVYHLNKSCEQLDYIFSSQYDGDVIKPQRDLHKISTPYFSCHEFSEISLGDYMNMDGNLLQLECGIRTKSLYFFFALIKTFLELGGQTYTNSTIPSIIEDEGVEKDLEPYFPHHRFWKRIKKWEEMCQVERAAFKGKFS